MQNFDHSTTLNQLFSVVLYNPVSNGEGGGEEVGTPGYIMVWKLLPKSFFLPSRLLLDATSGKQGQ